jgi:hypothetical protein
MTDEIVPEKKRKTYRNLGGANPRKETTEETVPGKKKRKEWVMNSDEQVRAALKANNGLIAPSARYLNIERACLQNRLLRNPELRLYQQDCAEAAKDHATSKLFENIDKNMETAIEFYLRTQARDRGFGEASLINVNQNNLQANIDVDLSQLSTEELENLNGYLEKITKSATSSERISE